ncbi:MAG: hypothetical protein IID45_03055 [Planctomycetes bacterium]|nr:hypothetical protein [Planctomycetota bacterium]
MVNPSKTAVLLASFGLASVSAQSLFAAEQEPRGYQPTVHVSSATRLDWIFALSNQSREKPPASWLKDYESAKQTYELFVPTNYDPKKSWPVVLFVSPGNRAMGWRCWRDVCMKRGVIFAGAHGAGNRCPTPRRVKILMDVLDDVRRRFHTDADRTYLSGFSGGGRIACAVAFSLPEYFGGVVSICASGELRREPWLRQRVIDWLNVAMATGERDFNRGEVERYRGPMLAAVGVRSRVWTIKGMGHTLPPTRTIEDIFRWLETGVSSRRKLALRYPASRIAATTAPTRKDWSERLFAEAQKRTRRPKTLYSGLRQLAGIRARWHDLPAAVKATKLLRQFESLKNRPWEKEDIAEQRRFLIARARSLDSYATGPLPKSYAAQQPAMAKAALNLWRQVIRDGQDKRAVAQARKRIPVLEKLAGIRD